MVGTNCTVPACSEAIEDAKAYQRHRQRVHQFFRSYKCLKCELVIYHQDKHVVKSHLIDVHKVKRAVDQHLEEITESFTLFGNKKSSLIPDLEFPISESLHNLIKDLSIYDREIEASARRLGELFEGFSVDFDVQSVQSDDSGSNVYLKLDKSYLFWCKTSNKTFSFRRFLISLITGYIGETSDFSLREQGHNSSTMLYLTVRIQLFRLPNATRKVIENVVIKLLNPNNLANNNESGESYFIEDFSPEEHVFFVLDLLKSCFLSTKSFIEHNELRLRALELDANSQTLPVSQDSSKSIDQLVQLTSISDLRDSSSFNLKGKCKSKTRMQFANGGKEYFQFDLLDETGSVKVQCSNELANELFDKVQDEKIYLIRNAKLIHYGRSDNPKSRIELKNAVQICKVKVIH